MSDIICVTNRHLCGEPFTERIRKIADAHPAGIILREKDLSAEEYKDLASRIMTICNAGHTRCILHNYFAVATELGAEAFHGPLHILRSMTQAEREQFNLLGASCHSVDDALEAQSLGCNYITAGHIFETDCKKGLPGRGPDFLRSVCRSVSIPVYAIGGISAENIAQVRECGASGACIMSGLMRCTDPAVYLKPFEQIKREIEE